MFAAEKDESQKHIGPVETERFSWDADICLGRLLGIVTLSDFLLNRTCLHLGLKRVNHAQRRLDALVRTGIALTSRWG